MKYFLVIWVTKTYLSTTGITRNMIYPNINYVTHPKIQISFHLSESRNILLLKYWSSIQNNSYIVGLKKHHDTITIPDTGEWKWCWCSIMGRFCFPFQPISPHLSSASFSSSHPTHFLWVSETSLTDLEDHSLRILWVKKNKHQFHSDMQDCCLTI